MVTCHAQLARWQALASGGSPHSRGSTEPLGLLSAAPAPPLEPCQNAEFPWLSTPRRKGKPHPRHVRVLPSLRRLEWSKAGAGGGDSMVKVPPTPMFPCLLSMALAGAALPGTGRPRRFGAQPLPRAPKAVASKAAEFPCVRPFRRRIRRR